jgi:mannose-6-phosphate isomerase-like protein (cupin superfamily)
MIPQGRLAREFEAITEQWSPRVVADANGQYVKIAKVQGEFLWHAHAEEDEFFLVCRGTLILRFRDGSEVVLDEGGFCVVPRGVEHLPVAQEECWIMLVEPARTRHTGEIMDERTRSIEGQIAHRRIE